MSKHGHAAPMWSPGAAGTAQGYTLRRACTHTHSLTPVHEHQTPSGQIPDPLTSWGGVWGLQSGWHLMCEVNTVQARMWAGVCMCEFREAALDTSPSWGRTWLHLGATSTLGHPCLMPNETCGLWPLT